MRRSDQEHLRIVPATLKQANALVRRWHRHHGPVVGHKFSLAVMDKSGMVRGAAIVGRPVNRTLDDGWTAEVARVATDPNPCPNAASALYGACWRVAKAMGYRRLTTYILMEELGVSLRAAGWEKVKPVNGRSWDCPSRPRTDDHPLGDKWRWEIGSVPPCCEHPDFGPQGPSRQLTLGLP